MRHPICTLAFAGLAFVATAFAGTFACSAPPDVQKPAVVLTDAEKLTIKDFEKRINDYAALHQKLESSLPALPDKATPEQIDAHKQALGAKLKEARKDAKEGDFFTPAMVAIVRRASAATVDGADDKKVKETIMDENPGTLPNISVNDRYPDGVPVTTMPVQLLQTLPKLPPELEYRFLGKRLVIVCAPAQLVLDVTPDVLI